MQWNYILKQCFFCPRIIYPIITFQNKSHENRLIFDVSHMEFFFKFKNKNVSTRREWTNELEKKKIN